MMPVKRSARAWIPILLCVCMLVLAPGSAAALEFGGKGEGAGQIEQPHGVAVDQATGDIYVSDFQNNRVDEFEANGTFVSAWGWEVDSSKPEAKLQVCTTATGCQAGARASGAGGFDQPSGVAFDNVSTEPALYVVDDNNNRVQKFSPNGEFLLMWGGDVNKKGGSVCRKAEASECQQGHEPGRGKATGNGEFQELGRENPIAVGALGTVYVGDEKHVQWFDPEGLLEGSFEVAAKGNVNSIALAKSGDVYLTVSFSEEYFNSGSTAPELYEYSTAGKLEHSVSLEAEGEPASKTGTVYLASDGTGRLFDVEKFSTKHSISNYPEQILEYDESLKELQQFPPPSTGETSSSYPHSGGLALFEVAKEASKIVTAGGSSGVVAIVPTPAPGPTIEAEEAAAEPAATATLRARVDPENHMTKYHFEYGTEVGKEAASTEASLSASFEPEPVKVKIEHLIASTTYHYHVVAEDSEGHVVEGPDATFESLPALTIDSVSVSRVTSESARLEAEINPLGTESEYYFEYSAAGEASHRTEHADVADSTTDVTVSVPVQGLATHTIYTIRVLAKNVLGGAQAHSDFTTETGGSALALPDNRQWQMVSPPTKYGAFIFGPESEGPIQASAAGDGIAYLAASPTEADPEGYATVSVLALHGSEGWSSKVLDPPHANATGVIYGIGAEYRIFSNDLSLGVLQQVGEFAPLTPDATEATAYLHSDYVRGDVNERCSSDCLKPLVDGANVPAGVKFGARCAAETEGGGTCGPQFVDATPDLSRVLLTSEETGLTSIPAKGGLYEWSGGTLQLVSLLPHGETNSEGGVAAFGASVADPGFARNAISTDGSVVVWQGETATGSAGVERPYLRDMAHGETVRLGMPEGGSGTGAAVAKFEIASSDGSRVFFLDSERLTSASSASGSDLYEYDLNAPAGSRLTDLSVDTNPGEAASVQDVIGASEDGSYVYFTAAGVLASGAVPATCGETEERVEVLCNLYVRHDGVTKFVAALAAGDHGPLNYRLNRVSPDGVWLAFESQRSLTGYDTHDAISGKRDEEVYLYDASIGRLVCASCDPTGARPTGEGAKDNSAVTGFQIWNVGQGIDGVLPSWPKIKPDEYRHQPRYLSDNGRLFFDSHSALVSQDVNGNWDVYEYEPSGVGNCTTRVVTFSERSEGCVGLISSGGAAGESAFLDASQSGGDVFFVTAGKLVSQDYDTSRDIYDAHECTEASPCVPEPSASPPPCGDGESCKGAQTPQPAIYGAPASSTFVGTGNLAPARTAGASVKPKGLTRTQKLERALQSCRRKRAKRKRVACQRAAGRAYGAKASRRGIGVTAHKGNANGRSGR